jgi:hypothetical protein
MASRAVSIKVIHLSHILENKKRILYLRKIWKYPITDAWTRKAVPDRATPKTSSKRASAKLALNEWKKAIKYPAQPDTRFQEMWHREKANRIKGV